MNILLIGFSGTGKTVVGQGLAKVLGWDFYDTDDLISEKAGKSVQDIFEQDGEKKFRQIESRILEEICPKAKVVIATGGGVIADNANREIVFKNSFVICLEARADSINRRLFQTASPDSNSVRPLIRSDHSLEDIIALKSKRQDLYSLAHWTIHTDDLPVEGVVSEAVHGWEILGESSIDKRAVSKSSDITVRTAQGSYPVFVQAGLMDEIGTLAKSVGLDSTAYVIADETPFYKHGRRVHQSLESAGIPAHIFTLPSGEISKSIDIVSRAYQWLADLKAERGHVIVGFGGGLAGDVAGFIASTYGRGMPFIQIPTTLLSMVDASIGGKTAINLEEGKNLVGTFYQPMAVISDIDSLMTLPARELNSGWAEAIKHSLILDDNLFRIFENKFDSLSKLETEISLDVIKRSISIKADVVSQDVRETKGIRSILNYGHTVGHAIESVTGYDSFLHGEAVSIGMMAAAHLSNKMGLLDDDSLLRHESVLKSFGLPVACHGLSVDKIMSRIQVDKKTSGGDVKWVLLESIGKAVTNVNIPNQLVKEVLDDILA